MHHSIELFHQQTLMQHVEDNSVTNILLMNKENCALKLVDEIILLRLWRIYTKAADKIHYPYSEEGV